MWVQREVLILVKGYPEPSAIYRETVCTAGVTREEGLVRLYPVRFRALPPGKQYRKYQVVSMRMEKHGTDTRPESYRPDENSFVLGPRLSTRNGWAERRRWVLPVASGSMCRIRAEHKATGRSLGLFRPARVADLEIIHVGSQWRGRQKAKVEQLWFEDLSGPRRAEKIPWEFRYRYRCQEPGCKGHRQRIVDWEIMALYRNLRDRAMTAPEIRDRIEQKYLHQMCGSDKDTYFLVGNHSRHRASFMVLGVFWPPAPEPGLFAPGI